MTDSVPMGRFTPFSSMYRLDGRVAFIQGVPYFSGGMTINETNEASARKQSALFSAVDRYTTATVDLAVQIAEIAAPTFHEQRRAAFVQSQLQAIGLETWMDEAGNAYARRAGSGRGTILLAAHTDTVFPLQTDVTVRRTDGRLVGPGIGDNSVSVAALLTIPRVLDDAGIGTEADILLCADTGEEGLGNLRGIRRAVADYGKQLSAVVAIEGHHLGTVYNRAIGSRRLRIEVKGPGGHSWGAFGNPSAIHVLGEIIAAIARIPVPREPKTTFNVGTIEGGVSINTIAPVASLTLDMRSVDPTSLTRLESEVQAILERLGDLDQGISVRSEVIGDRPAGEVPEDAPIIQMAIDILQDLGIQPHLDAGSTDANIPIAEGIPAVCIGLTSGGNSHRTDEYIDVDPLSAGLKQLALLTRQLAAG